MNGEGMPSALPGANPNADRSSEIIGGSVVLIVLPTVFVILRLLSRWMSRASLWWDDYTVIIACVFSWGDNLLDLIGRRHGFGRHIYSLGFGAIGSFFKNLYAFGLLYSLAMFSVKLSIILFQYRIFPIVQYRRFLIGCLVFVTSLGFSSVLVCIFSCTRIPDYWETYTLGKGCINVIRFFKIAGGINAATDFVLLAMPIPLLWRLRTSVLQKIILTFIFTIGLVVCCVSVVRLVLLSSFNKGDITWSYVSPALWTAAEPSIGVVSACLPSLRPLFAKLVWGRAYRPKIFSSTTRSGSLGYSGWRSGQYQESKDRPGGSFNRLGDDPHASGDRAPWRNNVDIRGGRREGDVGSEEINLGGGGLSAWPKNGIKVRTTVTVTEKVDWQDDLF